MSRAVSPPINLEPCTPPTMIGDIARGLDAAELVAVVRFMGLRDQQLLERALMSLPQRRAAE